MLSKTRFATFSGRARLLQDEMRALRSSGAANWWRSHFTEACRCPGCRGQETDLFAVFEADKDVRFALHFEVKQPTDRFPPHKDQAANYALRAECWTKTPPKSVLPHSDAATVLLCSQSRLTDYTPHLPKFGSVITFEAVADAFPASGIKTS